MKELFIRLLDISISGSVIICIALIARLLLKKAPRNLICLLWLLAGVRLLVPFQIESNLSLQPEPAYTSDGQVIEEILDFSSPVIEREVLPDFVPQIPAVASQTLRESTHVLIDFTTIAAYVWIVIAWGIVLYAFLSFFLFKRKVSKAVQLEDGVFECGRIETAFILGFVRPNIYLPTGLSQQEKSFVLAHERSHLERGDHWIKLLGFICLGIHWFNPLVWLGYILLCRDIEIACDERVVKYMKIDERKAYSQALLTCSTGHHYFAGCPVAFGEVSIKGRILNVLKYRKPGFWISLSAVAAAVLVGIFFLTSPILAIHSEDPAEPVVGEEALALCETALKNYQSLDCYSLEIETVYDGDSFYNGTATTRHWQSGEDYLHIQQDLFGYLLGYLRKENESFSRTSTGGNTTVTEYSDWLKGETSAAAVSCWLDTFDWGSHSITYKESQAAMGDRIITVLINEPEDSRVTSPYTVTFCIGKDNRLETVRSTKIITDEAFEPDKIYRISETIQIYPADPAEVQQLIDSNYQQAIN